MTLWNGPTYECPKCSWVNAIIRKNCRKCNEKRPDTKEVREFIVEQNEFRRTHDVMPRET